jgi:hypothetical protein
MSVVVGVAVGLAACTSGDPFEALPVPDRVPAPTTSSVAPPDFSGVVLAPVEGSTTTSEVVVGPGRSALTGRVDGPDGPVQGAVVRLERLVGDASARLDVTTGPDGIWQAPEILGGRYRIRAWRTPGLAMLEPQILFLEAGRTADTVMVLERFQALAVDTAIAPDPPFVGQRTNLLVRISSQIVDEDGVVRATPEAGVAVTLGTGLGWTAESPVSAVTTTAGSVTFTLVCRSPGPQPLMVTLPPPNAPPAPGTTTPSSQPPGPPASLSTVLPLAPAPQVFNLDLPECMVPPPPPTVPSPTTTGPTTTGTL